MIIENTAAFFGEGGISATSARHLANRAKEEVTNVEAKLNSASFVKKTIKLYGTPEELLEEGKGEDYLNGLSDDFEYLGKMHAFQAWMNEAIKAKTKNTQFISGFNLFDYCEAKGIEVPVQPVRGHSITFDDVLGRLNVKERQEYYYLNAYASQIGKFIVSGAFSNAKSEFERSISRPASVKENGRDTIIYRYEGSVSPESLLKVHTELMEKNRSLNARLNAIKFKLEEEVNDHNMAIAGKYKDEYEVYSRRVTELENELLIWKKEQLNQIQKLKITIPKDLEDVYNRLKSND